MVLQFGTRANIFQGKIPSMIDVTPMCNIKRFVPNINFVTGVRDVHNIVCFAMNVHVPRSQEKFIERTKSFKHDVENASYHVGEIFDDFDDKFWFQKQLLECVINGHAPVKRRKATKKNKNSSCFGGSATKACYNKATQRNIYFKDGRTKSWLGEII